MTGYDWLTPFISYEHSQQDRTGEILMVMIIVGGLLWVMLRDVWTERRTGEPMDPEFDERQRQVRLKASQLTLHLLEIYLIAWVLLSSIQLVSWANDVLTMGLAGIVLSALVFRGYCEFHDATQDSDRRKFPFNAVITAAIQCVFAASQWIRYTHEVDMWELREQGLGELEVGPYPTIDGLLCVFTVMAAGTTVLAAIALWRWLRERRHHETEET